LGAILKAKKQTPKTDKSMKKEIEAGDTVRLKSGGLTMTVGYTDKDTTVCYYYIQDKATFEQREFPTITLKIPD
jgi:uncharacterized protein YodC (DUF2158 family)